LDGLAPHAHHDGYRNGTVQEQRSRDTDSRRAHWQMDQQTGRNSVRKGVDPSLSRGSAWFARA
jgi:hypothetical protein